MYQLCQIQITVCEFKEKITNQTYVQIAQYFDLIWFVKNQKTRCVRNVCQNRINKKHTNQIIHQHFQQYNIDLF